MNSNSNPTAKLTIKALLKKGDAAWRIQLKDLSIHWIPNTCIQSWDPNTCNIEIETWILIKKEIKFVI